MGKPLGIVRKTLHNIHRTEHRNSGFSMFSSMVIIDGFSDNTQGFSHDCGFFLNFTGIFYCAMLTRLLRNHLRTVVQFFVLGLCLLSSFLP